MITSFGPRFINVQSGKETESLSEQANLKLDLYMIPIYLTIGFIPGYHTLFKDVYYVPPDSDVEIKNGELTIKRRWRWEDLVTDGFQDYTEGELIDHGIMLWKQAKLNCYESRAEHVVPLSGGLDSRAILAVLLEHREASRIHTYTFGTPGTYDYEIGNLVAKYVGTKHHSFDLREYHYTQECLEEIADRSDGNINVFFHAPWQWIIETFGWGMVHWTGYFGDRLTGVLAPTSEDERAPLAQVFLQRNQVVSGKIVERLCDVESNPSEWIERYKLEGEIVNRCSFIDFYNQEERWYGQALLLRGLSYKAPHLDRNWASFMLSAPREWRAKQGLYKAILLRGFPELFRLPIKSAGGVPLDSSPFQRTVHKMYDKARELRNHVSRAPSLYTSYIDFAEGIRKRADLKHVIQENLTLLKGRGLFDGGVIDRLASEHLARKQNHSRILQLLVSLEIIIRRFDAKIEAEGEAK